MSRNKPLSWFAAPAQLLRGFAECIAYEKQMTETSWQRCSYESIVFHQWHWHRQCSTFTISLGLLAMVARLGDRWQVVTKLGVTTGMACHLSDQQTPWTLYFPYHLIYYIICYISTFINKLLYCALNEELEARRS